MALYKELHELKLELQKLELEQPHNCISNWTRIIRIKSVKNKICKIEVELLERKMCKKS